MPNTYRGRVLIECTREVCERDRSRANVTPSACLDCPGALVTVIDLEEKPVGRIQRAPILEPEITEEAAKAPESYNKKSKGRK